MLLLLETIRILKKEIRQHVSAIFSANARSRRGTKTLELGMTRRELYH
jgi:hypothetical protein